MKMGARLASIAAVCLALLLVTAWAATGASAWTGLRDTGDVRISGAIGEITPEPMPPILGAAGYDCGAGVFEVAVRNPNGSDLAVMVELWLAAADDPRTPTTKLGEAAHTLAAGSTAWLSVGADDPADGLYRLMVDAPAVDAALWSGVVMIPAACEAGDPPPAEPTEEPAETETPPVTEAATTETPAETETPAVTETPAPTDEPTAEPTDEPAAEPTTEPAAEPTQEPAPEEAATPEDGATG